MKTTMRKILDFFAICCMAFVLMSCSSGPVDKLVKLFEEATAKVEKAENPDALTSITHSLTSQTVELTKEYPDFTPSEKDEERIQQAQQAFQTAYNNKISDFRKKIDYGDTEVFDTF